MSDEYFGGLEAADLSGGKTERDEEIERANREAQSRRDLQDVLSTPAGRRCLFEQLQSFGVFVPVFNHREAGAQQAGMLLRDRIKAAGLDYWHAIIRENDK